MATPDDMADRLKALARLLENETGRRILIRSQTEVARIASQKYMQRDRIGPRSQSDNGPLRIQTSRLVRSLTGAREGSRGRQEGISDITSNGATVRLTFGTRVPYAATHEFGDTRTVTPQMRAFFWAKHKETEEDRWKAMALSERLTYPRRSFLRPAAGDATPTIRAITLEEVAADIAKTLE